MTFLLAAAALAAAQPPAAPTQAADEAQLRRIKTEIWPGYYRNQDVEGLSGFLAGPFLNVAPDGSQVTRAGEIAWLRANRWEARNFSYSVDRIAWLDPDLVLIVGRGASDRADEAGRPCRHNYVSSNLLRRAPGAAPGWQALSSHVSGVSCVPRN